VLACCADLRVLGKGEFKSLLKWRLKMVSSINPQQLILLHIDSMVYTTAAIVYVWYDHTCAAVVTV
jgi:Domain of unknown function (DUF3381)